ncbi:hypothetical protein ACLMJK_006210 [Lecanora helva]
MADPLSVAGSIAGLIALAEGVFRRTYSYVQAFKNASKDICTLSSEIGALVGVLHSVRLVADQLEAETSRPALRMHHIYFTHQTLEKISAKLEKDRPLPEQGQRLENFKKKLRWPFSHREVETLILELGRHKQTLALALNADSMLGLLQAFSKQDEIVNSIEGLQNLLEEKREAETRIAIDSERQRILKSFGEVDPRNSHEMNRKIRHHGTGVWLTESPEFQDCLVGESRSLWLYGIPGAGKTVLASLAIDEALNICSRNIAVAYFYCDYKNPATQEVSGILGSLFAQIAKQDEQSFKKLQEFYDEFNPEKRDNIKYDPKGMCDLFGAMTSMFDHVMIIVDALNECVSNAGEVIEMLVSLRDCGTLNLKTLFSSRDEPDIRELLGTYTQIPIAARSSDLRLYVAAEIESRTRKKKLRIKDQSLKTYMMDRLIEGAEGMFRWVTCQIDHLCELPNDATRRKTLESLPPDLNSIYDRILARATQSRKEVQIYVQRTLRWLAQRGDFRTEALLEAISIDIGDTRRNADKIPDEIAVLSGCSSLVRQSTDRNWIELAHFTVKEYLLELGQSKDSKYTAYGFGEESAINEITQVCLTYLNFEDFDQGGTASLQSTVSRCWQYPFRIHALAYWLHYGTSRSRAEIGNSSLLRKLFHPSKPNGFTSWAFDRIMLHLNLSNYEIDGYELNKTVTLGVAEAGPLHFAVLEDIPNLCSWLIENGSDVNRNSIFGTPLHCALLGWSIVDCKVPPFALEFEQGYITEEVVNILLEANADPNAVFDTPTTRLSPLGIAIKSESLPVVLRLLEMGAWLDEDCLAFLEDGHAFNSRDLQEILGLLASRNALGEHRDRLIRLALDIRESDLDVKLSDDIGSQLLEGANSESTLRFAAKLGQIDIVRRLVDSRTFDIDSPEKDTGVTALHYAAANDHLQVLQVLLNGGCNLDKTDLQGKNALHHSIYGSAGDCLIFLLKQNIEINRTDKDGCNIIHLASKIDNGRSLAMLLEQADSSMDFNSKSPEGQTALMFAAGIGNAEGVKSLLLRGCDPTVVDNCGWTLAHHATYSSHQTVLSVVNDGGLDWNKRVIATICSAQCDDVTVLHLAAEQESSTILKFLLSENLMNDINAVTNRGETALFIATLCELSDNVAVLLRYGADTTIKDTYGGESPIHCAASRGDESTIAEFLKYKCDIMTPDRDGLTPEFIALKHGHESVAKLLRRGIDELDPEIRRASSSSTFKHSAEAIKVAIDRGDLELCKRAADEATNMDFTYSSCAGCTPLLYAFHQGQLEIVEFLMSLGASITGTTCQNRSTRGYTAFHYASRDGSPNILQALLERDPSYLLRLSDPIHPIHLAVVNGHTICVKLIIESVNTELERRFYRSQGGSICSLKELVNLSIDTDRMHWPWEQSRGFHFPRYFCNTRCLHIAAEVGNTELAKLLIHHGATIDSLEAQGETALHFAARTGATPLVRLLLDAGAKANAVNIGLETPWMLAASKGHRSCLQAFVNFGVDLQLRNRFGLSILHIAAFAGGVNVVEFLINHTTGYKLEDEDISGVSILSCMLCSMPIFTLNLAPSPNAYMPRKGNILAYAAVNCPSKIIRMLLRRLPRDVLPVLLSHRAECYGTPLYAATTNPDRQESIRMIHNAGADLELEGGEYGTPLMGACATGRLEALKILVALGTKTSYVRDGEVVSALRVAKNHPDIIRWLLVGRFSEAPRLITSGVGVMRSR